MPKVPPRAPSPLSLEASKVGLAPRIRRHRRRSMGFNNDASKDVCCSQGVTVVHPIKTGLSFRLELYASNDIPHGGPPP
jgi:hypothetical protein